MIVHTGQDEHHGEAEQQPFDLLYMHSGEIAGVGGRVDLHNAQRTNTRQDGEEPPVVVASAGSFFHCGSGSESAV